MTAARTMAHAALVALLAAAAPARAAARAEQEELPPALQGVEVGVVPPGVRRARDEPAEPLSARSMPKRLSARATTRACGG